MLLGGGSAPLTRPARTAGALPGALLSGAGALLAVGLGLAAALGVYLDGLWSHRLQVADAGANPAFINDLPYVTTVMVWVVMGAAIFLAGWILVRGEWDRPLLGLLAFSLFADAIPGTYQGSLFLIGLLLVMRGIRRGNLPFVLSPLVFPVGLVIISYATTLIYSGKVANVLPNMFFRSTYLALVLILPQIIRTRRHLEILLHYLIIAAVITASVAIFQFIISIVLDKPVSFAASEVEKADTPFGKVARATGLMPQPNHLANALSSIAVLLTYFATRPRHLIQNRTRVLYLVVAAFLCLGVFTTISRSGWLALTVCLGLVPLLRWPRFAPLYVLGMAVVLAVGFQTGLIQAAVAEVRDINKSSADFRWKIDMIAIQAWLESPWIGHGVQSMTKYFNAYNLQVHNSYLQVLSEMGLFGVLAFGSLFVVLVTRMLERLLNATNRIDRDWIIGLTVCAGITMLQSMFAMYLWLRFLWALVAVTETVILISRRQAGDEEPADLVFLPAPGPAPRPAFAHGT